jgi:hypothetical protein
MRLGGMGLGLGRSGGAPAAPVFNPASVPDLAVYLNFADAAGTQVTGARITRAVDLSGNGNHHDEVGASGPALALDAVDGLGVARFSTATQLLTNILVLSPAQITIVIKIRSELSAAGSLINIYGKGGAFGATCTYSIDMHVGTFYCEGADGSRSECTYNASGAGTLAAARTLTLRTAAEAGNTRKKLYLNGVERGSSITTGGNGSLDVSATPQGTIGKRSTFNAPTVDVRSIVIHSRTLTDVELAYIEAGV